MQDYAKKFARKGAQQNSTPVQAETNGIPNSALQEVFAGRKHATSEMMGHSRNLAPSIAAKMSQAFGMDLTGMQVYQSDAMKGTGMRGMAQGNKVVLSSDVNLNTTAGQAVLGHEISHIHAQSQGIGMGHSGLYENAALEHQADTEGMLAAQGKSIYQDGMDMGGGMQYGLGMQGVEGMTTIGGGMSANAGAPMQAGLFKSDKPENAVERDGLYYYYKKKKETKQSKKEAQQLKETEEENNRLLDEIGKNLPGYEALKRERNEYNRRILENSRGGIAQHFSTRKKNTGKSDYDEQAEKYKKAKMKFPEDKRTGVGYNLEPSVRLPAAATFINKVIPEVDNDYEDEFKSIGSDNKMPKENIMSGTIRSFNPGDETEKQKKDKQMLEYTNRNFLSRYTGRDRGDFSHFQNSSGRIKKKLENQRTKKAAEFLEEFKVYEKTGNSDALLAQYEKEKALHEEMVGKYQGKNLKPEVMKEDANKNELSGKPENGIMSDYDKWISEQSEDEDRNPNIYNNFEEWIMEEKKWASKQIEEQVTKRFNRFGRLEQ